MSTEVSVREGVKTTADALSEMRMVCNKVVLAWMVLELHELIDTIDGIENPESDEIYDYVTSWCHMMIDMIYTDESLVECVYEELYNAKGMDSKNDAMDAIPVLPYELRLPQRRYNTITPDEFVERKRLMKKLLEAARYLDGNVPYHGFGYFFKEYSRKPDYYTMFGNVEMEGYDPLNESNPVDYPDY